MDRIEQLIERFRINDERITISTLDELRRIGKPAVPALIRALKDDDLAVRWCAASVLCNIRDARALPALIGSLEDKSEIVRWKAKEALNCCNCRSIEDFETAEKAEKAIIEGSKKLRRGLHADMRRTTLRVMYAKLLIGIAEKKNELAPKRGLLLPDSIKPPKKEGMYKSFVPARNKCTIC